MWFKVDDSLPLNPKIMECSLEAIGLWTLAGAWSAQQLTDGSIPKHVLQVLRGSASIAGELVASGLWDEGPDAYQFHDWLGYQFSAEDVKTKRAQKAESGRKGGLASGRSRREAGASSKRAKRTNPHPNPSHTSSNEEVLAADAALDAAFTQFWKTYPRKDDKKAARKAWDAAVKRSDVGTIQAGVESYAEAVKREGTERQFIKHGSTWLNNDCWDNDYQPAQPTLEPPIVYGFGPDDE
jgi:hypothetical protein